MTFLVFHNGKKLGLWSISSFPGTDLQPGKPEKQETPRQLRPFNG
jgi:hypothetical protein